MSYLYTKVRTHTHARYERNNRMIEQTKKKLISDSFDLITYLFKQIMLIKFNLMIESMGI